MLRSWKLASRFSGALAVGYLLGAGSQLPLAHADVFQELAGPFAQPADEAPEPPPDPKRKKAGEPCKSSNECQRHHTCANVGDQNIYQAPPRHQLPLGAATQARSLFRWLSRHHLYEGVCACRAY